MPLQPEQYPYTDYRTRQHPNEEGPIFESIKDLHTGIPNEAIELIIQAILAKPEGQKEQFCYDLVTIVKQLTGKDFLAQQTSLYHAGRRIWLYRQHDTADHVYADHGLCHFSGNEK